MQNPDLGKQFEAVIKEHESLIHQVCRMYANNETDREDLFQEMVIQLWRAYPNYKGQSKISTWLYRVAINTAITGLRRKRDFITSYAPEDLPKDMPEDQQYAKEEEQTNSMYSAIETLTEVEKAIVMMYMEERSYEEMEDVLGISQGNLRVKMTRIKEKLRQITKHN